MFMILIIIIAGVISNMNKFSRFSQFEDLKRIKSSYMPKTHFRSVYTLVLIFMVFMLVINRTCKNFKSSVFNFEKLHTKSTPNTPGVYNHAQ
jgi:hypothetical protein